MTTVCLFCLIAEGTAPATIDFKDETLVAFRDIHPVAPVHILLVPRKHIPSVADLSEDDAPLVWSLVSRANALAEKTGIAQSGYRLVFNIRHHAGQVVDHLHLHLIGGKQLGPPAT